MNKIKEIWQENKILLVLAIILLVCLIVLIGVAIKYFYGSSDTVYGNRLDIIKDTPISSETLKKVESTLKTNEEVESVSTSLKGRILYIHIKLVNDTKMDRAKEIASTSLELFKEAELAVYDLQFSIEAKMTKEDKDNKSYTLMGSKNANGKEDIVWNNYNIANLEDSEG